MIYTTYGETFRRIREQKKLSLSDFASVNIPKSTLSRFESGKSMMSFDKLYLALQFMEISLEEYEHFINNYFPNNVNSLLQKLEEATFSQNKKAVLEIADLAEKEGFHFIALAAKSLSHTLTDKEIKSILDYLYGLNFWSFQELSIFHQTLNLFPTKDIINFSDFLFAPQQKFLNSQKYNQYLVQAACRAISVLSIRDCKDRAKQILDFINNHHLATENMYLHNLFNLTHGLWVYRFKDSNQGMQEIKKALDIFKAVESEGVYSYYHSLFIFYIKMTDMKRSKIFDILEAETFED